ncbi:aldehyde dehydrogenase family protein [Cloacibacillus evryensis]|uniref:aldehyde dehydrogenase family protein n=1 Tax=Cloacibacillus evryensis TaxID=508460 RepID=UPI0024200FB1|nr:aldehyde dehydrogenase family protein [Cloacibacillus evryensis]
MSLRKKLVMGAVVAFSVSAVAVSAFAATEEKAVVVGNESLKPNEVVEVLQSTAGGNPMMVGLMLSQATLAERAEMAKQMADAMLFAEGARISGLADREDVALKIKWQRMQLLLEAYLQEISKKWDMGDKAMKKYYSEHKGEFVQAPAAHIRHILTSTEKDANNAILDIFKNKDFAKTAEKFSRDADVGMVGVNVGICAPHPYVPFGGIKGSLLGTDKVQGKDGLNFFTQNKVTTVRTHHPKGQAPKPAANTSIRSCVAS